jgi:hypothetical protein
MKPSFFVLLSVGMLAVGSTLTAPARTVVFFDPTQSATNVAPGDTWDTLSSCGYLFKQSMDKWWYPGISIGGGTPTGRPVRIPWPDGVEAQAVTAGPNGMLSPGRSAQITISRVDGAVFAIQSFTAKLLANTAGAGASFEIMPQLNGQDAFADPLVYDATGYGGMSFSYSDPKLSGYDTYSIALYVDFGLTALTLVDASVPSSPALSISVTSTNTIRLSWPTSDFGFSLQSSPDLEVPLFTNVEATPAIEGNLYVVTLPITNSQSFFRLAQ